MYTETIFKNEQPSGTVSATTFGNRVSDHLLIGHYQNGQWQEPEIIPYGKLSIAPTNLALHYGQSVFEGMKAFRMIDGKTAVFRIDKHHTRLNRSLERMCMPALPFEYFNESVKELVTRDITAIPSSDMGALYIRPFVFATDETFGVKISETYRFVIFTGAVGAYYDKPLYVKVETQFIRAAEGGSGYAKCAGNYGSAFYPTRKANEQGFDQLLWTDSKYHEFIEESGTMNVFFVIDDVLITPPLSGTILDGVTRDSLLQLAKDMEIKVQERKISYHELIAAFEKGTLQEAFGAGTAAIISPIARIHIAGKDYHLPAHADNALSFTLKQKLQAIRTGESPDHYHWNTIIG